jgi:CHAT domain-containing protein
MTTFYSDWLKNYTLNNKRASLRKAQLTIKQKYPHPLFWGAFVMIGK